MDVSDHNLSADTSSEIENELALRSFTEYSSDEISETWLQKEISNPMQNIINNVFLHRAQFNTSYAAASAFAKALNEMPGSQLNIPTSKERLKSAVSIKFLYEHYVFCNSCEALMKLGEKCNFCKQKTEKTKDNYFIYIPIKQQIEFMLNKYLKDILKHLNQKHSNEEISDVLSGEIYKKEKAVLCNETLLPLTVNLDGAKIFASSTWPVQLTQNYLPPHIRFRAENVLVVGLYCGKKNQI